MTELVDGALAGRRIAEAVAGADVLDLLVGHAGILERLRARLADHVGIVPVGTRGRLHEVGHPDADDEDAFSHAPTSARALRSPRGSYHERREQRIEILTEITRQIRQTLLEPNELSLDAKNVTIVTSAGHVTLIGVVTSDDERREVLRIARAFAGGGRVSEDLESGPTEEVKMTKAVVCMASSMEHADRILCELMDSDFANEDISILYPDRMGVRDFAHAPGTRAPEGGALGAGLGGALGAVVGLALGTGVVAFPTTAAFLAAGPLMAALGGTGVGAATGGVTRARFSESASPGMKPARIRAGSSGGAS